MKEVRMMKRIAFLVLALVMVFGAAAHGDRGGIPFVPNVKIYEPGQKAIVAWHAGKEVLILSTDVTASADTKVIEIMPFPSDPKVEKAEPLSFVYVEYLVNRAIKAGFRRGRHLGPDSKNRNGAQVPGVEIRSHQKIGAHDITTLKVNNVGEFITWIEAYFQKHAKQAKLPEALRKIIGAYVKEGYCYFAFDVIELSKKKKSVEPIMYTFDSKCLYYPLKISSLYEADTEIILATVTESEFAAELMPKGFKKLSVKVNVVGGRRPRKKGLEVVVPTIPLSQRRLKKISPKVKNLFGDGKAVLQMWRYKGTLKVDTDVLVALAGTKKKAK